MPRRPVELLVILALGFLGAPLASGAPLRKVVHIGRLDDVPFWEPFRQGLRELGYVEGENLALAYRPTEGRRERVPELAAELGRQLW